MASMKNKAQGFKVRSGSKHFILWMMLFSFLKIDAQQNGAFPFLVGGGGLVTFKGDNIRTSPAPFKSLYAGYQLQNFRFSAGMQHAYLLWNRQERLNLENFRAEISAMEFNIQYHLPLHAGDFPVFLFGGAGLGYSWFASYADLRAAGGQLYILWSDGTMRDLPELPQHKFTAQRLSRDYRYETPLAVRQTSLMLPLSLGVYWKLDQRIRLGLSWKMVQMQSDYLDLNTSNAGWDRLNLYELSIGFDLKRIEKTEKPADKRPIPYEPGIDAQVLLFSDQDNDGVADLYDLCDQTPEGVTVNKQGCPPDSDADGVPDYIDQERETPAGSWVEKNGVARSDQWIQTRYNDSLAWFTQPLRKFYKNCRPYPVKKHIPASQYNIYAHMLELHPEWRTYIPRQVYELPAEFKMLDSNNDRIISVEELDQALNAIFDDAPGAISIEKFNEAMRYAFEIQN